jgi:integrase
MSLAFNRLRRTCDLPGVRLHDLRHFNASALLAGGTDLRTVSGRLGHADASTTLGIYAHFIRHADEKAAGTIGAVLDG